MQHSTTNEKLFKRAGVLRTLERSRGVWSPHWAHNPGIDGSNPSSAIFFMIILKCGCQVTEEGKFIVGKRCENCETCSFLENNHPFN